MPKRRVENKWVLGVLEVCMNRADRLLEAILKPLFSSGEVSTAYDACGGGDEHDGRQC